MSPDVWQGIGVAVGGVVISAVGWAALEIRKGFKTLGRRLDRSPEVMALTVPQDIEISILLETVRRKLGAKRTHLNRFCNGDRYLDGGHIMRVQRSHERVEPGDSYQAEVFRGMLTTSIPHEMELVIKPGPSFTKVVDLPDCKSRWLCDSGGTVAVARCAVRRDGELVGFVGADFGGAEQPPNIIELCQVARDIGIILAFAQEAEKRRRK